MKRSGRVQVKADVPSKSFAASDLVDSSRPAGSYPDVVREKLSIKINRLDAEAMEFELSGVDASTANALRRIMIAEVPTVAMEFLTVYKNSSILQEEILAQRLGLIPIAVDPKVMDTLQGPIIFSLNKTCHGDLDSNVYSGDLEWVPTPDQESHFTKETAPRPVHDDILIVKLLPGQTVEIEAECIVGVGQDHSKFSPVCTASYRLLPQIELKEPVKGKRAAALVSTCPMGVFDIEDGMVRASNPRNCTMCRECLRSPDFINTVKLSRVSNHFLFSVESTGSLSPEEIFKRSIAVLADKCDAVLECLHEGELSLV